MNTHFNSSPTDTRSKIIQAASNLFAERGYAGTTTRSIAERADVNEVTLFRHFGTKENLAREIMSQYGGQAIAEKLSHHLTGDYRQDLLLIGKTLLQVMHDRNDAMRMAICEAGNFPEFREVVADNPRQLRMMLARYFESLMDNHQIRSGHPELLAQAFLGMFFSYTVLQGFLLDNLDPEPTPPEVVEGFVDLFIHGTEIHRE
jgi:AcrR family transcriptional regulator